MLCLQKALHRQSLSLSLMDLIDYFETEDTKYLNPNTQQVFKFGDLYNGKHFVCVRNGKPSFMDHTRFLKELERKKKRKDSKRTISMMAKQMIREAQKRAMRKNGRCDIDIHRLEKEILKGSNYGFQYSIGKSGSMGKRSPYVPSLDRIDSSNPNYIYTSDTSQDTCRLVPYGINNLRNNFLDSDMLPLASAYVRVHLRELQLVCDSETQTD